ncbi:MAG: hypothetical protein ACP5K8_09350 [Nitrososphaeria archaeon]
MCWRRLRGVEGCHVYGLEVKPFGNCGELVCAGIGNVHVLEPKNRMEAAGW